MALPSAYSVLVVSSNEKFSSTIKLMLPVSKFPRVDFSTSAAAARREMSARAYDILLITSPLQDEFGTNLAIDVCEKTTSGVLLFVKNDRYDEVNAKVAPFGVLTLSIPTSTRTMRQTIDLLCSIRERMRRLEKKNVRLEEKMSEIRVVNRAKWILIEHQMMTEEQAHRFIEKTAMDECITKRAVAEKIISDTSFIQKTK